MKTEEEIRKELKTYEEGWLVQDEELYTTLEIIQNACEQSVIRALKWVLEEGEE